MYKSWYWILIIALCFNSSNGNAKLNSIEEIIKIRYSKEKLYLEKQTGINIQIGFNTFEIIPWKREQSFSVLLLAIWIRKSG